MRTRYLPVCLTVETDVIVRVTRSLINRKLWINTQRASHADSFRGVVIDVLGGDDGARRRALFDPLFERVVNAMFRPLGSGGAKLAERAGAGTANAMLHAGNHVEAHEALSGTGAHGVEHAVVIVDTVRRRDGRIVPTVIEDEFTAAGPKVVQIGFRGVEGARGLFVGGLHGGIDLGSERIPSRIFEHHVAEVILHIDGATAATGSIADEPGNPAAASVFGAGRVTGKDGIAVRVASAGVEFLERGNLRRGEAGARIHILAEQRGGIEVAAGGVVEDAVLHAVLRVARGEHRGANGRKLDAGDVSGGLAVA